MTEPVPVFEEVARVITLAAEAPFSAGERMPGHWLLSRIGKRVLRPGGFQLTRRMLEDLNIQADDDVIEFAPGLGVTLRRS